MTALAASGQHLWLGTRRSGIWEYNGRTWRQHLQPAEPFAHDAQAFAAYHGCLYVSTLEDGLSVRTADGWQSVTLPEISTVAPRQMAEFKGALYVRHGSGKVDRFDGRVWTRDVCSTLPRKQASMIASDPGRLYVAQWGGWSEYDGTAWTHFLKLPELQGRTVTALHPDGDTLWIGTQNHGLAEFSHRTGQLTWHDERQGLPDDWITAIAREGRTLYAGTYVGGLARWNGAKWSAGELSGANVTDFAPDGKGGLWIATRTGLWHRDSSGRLTPASSRSHFLDTEVQALQQVPEGLWVGTRTGLFFLANDHARTGRKPL
jgi:ligand-binding sensor domain-containing protein